jgi:2,3-bisphosphoglycerate-independent phosphoglycerate mutase
LDVPIIVTGSNVTGRAFTLDNGRLADVVPTLLELINVPRPPEMTGHSLVRFSAPVQQKRETSPAA